MDQVQDTTQTTLRDTLVASFDEVEKASIPPAEALETPVEKPVDKPRDETGKFKKEEKSAPTNLVSPSATPEVKRPPRPTSWKKDYEEHWNQLDPKLAEYIHQREREYASGVSTYKSEAEQAKSLNNAIAPFLPNLQKYGLEPTQWIQNLGTAHEMLALGSPQQKVMMGVKLINDYQIDPQALFQVLSGQIPFQPPQPQVDINKVLEEKLTEREIKGEFNKFLSQVEEKYPYYDQVKETMAGLLQAGLAQDYAGAYEAAIRHPRHSDIFEDMQRQQSEKAAQEEAQKTQAVVTRAKSNAISPKSATPSGPVVTAKENKSLRDDIASAFEAVAGRV